MVVLCYTDGDHNRKHTASKSSISRKFTRTYLRCSRCACRVDYTVLPDIAVRRPTTVAAASHHLTCHSSVTLSIGCPETLCSFRLSKHSRQLTHTHTHTQNIHHLDRPIYLRVYTCIILYIQCVPKSDTLLISEFSTLVRCIIFAIFVYLYHFCARQHMP